jgi:ABC-type polysaccharide/polyol phosphate transport system ATPase subunit
MAMIRLSDVHVEFPIYHASSRSIRRSALDGAFGRRFDVSGRRASVTALDGIDLEAADGDRLALIGPNGAGKSLLLRTIAGIYAPARGKVTVEGRVRPLLSYGIGMDMAATGFENIYLLGMHLDVPPAAVRRRIDEIVSWTELGPFIHAPLRTYSAGMIMRLTFAVSTAFPAEILLLDEWLALVDAEFQNKAQQRMSAFIGEANILVLASHSAAILELWCNRAVRLAGGRVVGRGSVRDMIEQAMPPAGA